MIFVIIFFSSWSFSFFFSSINTPRPSGAWKQLHWEGRNWLLEGSSHVQQNKIVQLEKTRCSWQRKSVTASESSKRFTSLCSNLGTITVVTTFVSTSYKNNLFLSATICWTTSSIQTNKLFLLYEVRLLSPKGSRLVRSYKIW